MRSKRTKETRRLEKNPDKEWIRFKNGTKIRVAEYFKLLEEDRRSK